MIESKYLEENIQNIQRIMSIPVLKDSKDGDLSKLLRLSKLRRYKDGEIIIKEGDNDPWFYFILSGKVRISKDNVDICTLNKEGDFFGEMRIIDSLSRSASVFSVGNTTCLAVDTKASDRLSQNETMEEFLVFLYRIFTEYMSARLRITNEELIIAKKEIERLKNKYDEKDG